MSLDEFLGSLSTTDTKKKLTVGESIITFLEDEENSVECEDLGSFVDALVPWMQSSNFKVSQHGLDVTRLMASRLGGAFRPHLNAVLPAVTDRLGDGRESVRERALGVVAALMDGVVEPQFLLEKMLPAFAHKNAKVREEMLALFQSSLNSYGAQSLTVSKFLPAVVALLSDPTGPVRDCAQQTLLEAYRHVGERLRQDLQKKYQLPAAKLNQLMSKFDEMRSSGDMMPTATLAMGTTEGNHAGDDETDRHSNKSSNSAKSRSSSVPAHVRKGNGAFTMPRPPTTESSRSSVTSVKRNSSMRAGPTSAAATAGPAGAMDEESFIAAFEDVKRVTIFSPRALTEEIGKIRETLSKSSNDWKVRVDALQMLRSLLLAGAANYDEMHNAIRTLDVPFQVSVKDLRSQVVREACITIAYFSQQLRNKVDRFLEFLLQPLINLIMNSAKVMSTSGIVCVRFIIQHTFSPRFLPIVTSNVSSKSREIRRHCCEFLDHLLHTWPTGSLEKHVGILAEAIKRGIGDADPDARQFARKAYLGFADHFKEQADQLLNSLEVPYRRLLQAGGEMSNSSSSNSLNMTGGSRGGVSTLPRSRQASVTGSSENLQEHAPRRGPTPTSATLGRKASGGSGIPLYTSPLKSSASPFSPFNGLPSPISSGYGVRYGVASPGSGSSMGSVSAGTPSGGMTVRSNSAIDPSAVRRAHVRAQYAQRNRIHVVASGSRSRKSSISGGTPDTVSPMPPLGSAPRSRSRVGGMAHSQPGSRSTSPTSLRSYQTYNFEASPIGSSSTNKTPRKRNGGGPFDDGASDDGSEASSISSIGGGGGGGAPSPMKPRYLQSPNSSLPLRKGAPGSSGGGPAYSRRISGGSRIDPLDDSENLNPEEVHKSLRSTASAIQNYSFETSPAANFKFEFLDGGKNSPATLEEKMSLLDMSGRRASGERFSPQKNGDAIHRNNMENINRGDDNAAIQEIMEILQSVKTQSQTTERRNCMTKLIRMSREGKTALIQENFRSILRLLLENLSDNVGATRALVFGVLTEMLKQEALIPSFQAFTELIILKVLEAHKDEEKDVERAAEGCAAAMAGVLPPDLVIRVLNPIIKTGDYPVNQAAIKMLTKVADHLENKDIIFQHLADMMPGLLKAYDNVESSVRKASVFCMVALHQMVGENLQPHLECLNGSKLKLLNLYIKRAQAQKEQSAPVSPRQLSTPM